MSRTLFTNGAVFDRENAARAGVTIVVEGRHVAAIETGNVESSVDDRVVDLHGRTLMPGMAQCHFHTGFGPDSGSVGPVLGLNMPAAYLGMVAAKNAQIAIDNGVTSIIGSSNGDLLDVCLKEAIALGQTRGPRVVPCTREMVAPGDDADGTNRAWFMQLGNTGLIRRVNGVDEIWLAVREEVGRGCEIVKLSIAKGHGVSPVQESLYFTPDEIQAAVDTAHELGVPVRAHCPSRKGVLACAQARVDIIDHADKIDEEGIEAVVAANASATPSMLWSERYIGFADSWDYNMGPFPLGNGFPEAQWQVDERIAGVREDYAHTVSILPKMVAAGINLVLGDDYGFAMMPHGDYVSEMEIYASTA